jgi:pimeloyl-ACP methyl ester carboxylesterase
MIMAITLGVIVVGGFAMTAVLAQRARAAAPPSGEFIEVEGATLHYVRAGEGPPLVILPCGGCPLQSFTASAAFEQAVESYDVIVFDRYGLGHSDLGMANALPSEQAALTHAALNELGIESPILMGHSASGAIAMAYAQAYETRGVVIVAGAVYSSGQSYTLLRAVTLPVVGDVLVNVLYVPLVNIASAFGAGGGGPDPLPESYLRENTILLSQPRMVKASAAQTVGVEEELPAITEGYPQLDVPVIYMVGSEDVQTFFEQGERLADEVPNATFEVVDGGGHSFFFGQPDELIDAFDDIPDPEDP